MAWLDDINQTIGSYDEQGNFIPGRLQGSYGENGMWEGTIGGQESFQNEQVTLPNGMTAYLDPPPAPGQPQTARILDPTGDQSKWTSVALDGEGNIVWSAPKEAGGSNVITGWVNDVGKNVVLPAIAGYLGVSGLAGLTGAAGAAGAAGGTAAEGSVMGLTGADAGAWGEMLGSGAGGAGGVGGLSNLGIDTSLGAGNTITGGGTGFEGGLSNLGTDTSLGAGTNLGSGGGFNTVTGSGMGLNPAAGSGLGFNASIPATAAFTNGALAGLPNIAATGAGGLTDITAGSAAINAANGLAPAGNAFAPAGTTVPNIANPSPATTGGLPTPGTAAAPTGTPSGTPGTSGAPSTGGFNPNWGGLLSSILGAVGANEQTKAYERIADRSWNAGEPSRGRFEASMTPGWDVSSIPGFSGALDASTNSYLKGISAKRGNPAGIGGAQGETQAYVVNNTALPWVNQYQNANMYAGGLASLSGNAQRDAMNAIQSQGNIYGQIGSGISDFMGDTSNNNSTNWLSELAKQFGGLKFS